MSRFSDLAKKQTAGSPVLQERTKISTNEIVARYQDGITINGFDFLNGKNGRYVVCCFRNDPGRYFNGGKILTNIFESFVAEYQHDEMTFNEALDACMKDFGPVGLKVKLSDGRTKDGNRVTLVEVLE